MDLNSLVLLTLLGLAAHSVWLHVKLSGVAQLAARRHCEKEGVQFLDQTVVLKRLAIVPSPRSLFALRRRYQFEFSSVGDQRYQGWVSLVGDRVEAVELPPFKVLNRD